MVTNLAFAGFTHLALHSLSTLAGVASFPLFTWLAYVFERMGVIRVTTAW